MKRSGWLSRGRRIKPVSAKRRADMGKRTALLKELRALVGRVCEYRDGRPYNCAGRLEGHEVRKPRERYWLNREYVVMLCSQHHKMAEEAYSRGRLEIPGTRSTGWGFRVVTAESKFAVRATADATALSRAINH